MFYSYKKTFLIHILTSSLTTRILIVLSPFIFPVLLQELFSKQKGFLEEELDYRKQALDQAYMVGVQ